MVCKASWVKSTIHFEGLTCFVHVSIGTRQCGSGMRAVVRVVCGQVGSGQSCVWSSGQLSEWRVVKQTVVRIWMRSMDSGQSGMQSSGQWSEWCVVKRAVVRVVCGQRSEWYAVKQAVVRTQQAMVKVWLVLTRRPPRPQCAVHL